MSSIIFLYFKKNSSELDYYIASVYMYMWEKGDTKSCRDERLLLVRFIVSNLEEII